MLVQVHPSGSLGSGRVRSTGGRTIVKYRWKAWPWRAGRRWRSTLRARAWRRLGSGERQVPRQRMGRCVWGEPAAGVAGLGRRSALRFRPVGDV